MKFKSLINSFSAKALHAPCKFVFIFVLLAQTILLLPITSSKLSGESIAQDAYHYYYPAAKNFVQSGKLIQRNGDFCTQHPPLYPMVLSVPLWLGDSFGISQVWVARILNLIFNAIACVGLFLFSKKYFSFLASFFSALLYGLYPPSIYLARDACNEPLFTALLIFGILFITQGFDKNRWLHIGSGFILLGLASLTRAISILVPCVVLIAGILSGEFKTWKKWFFCLTGVLVYMATIFPWSFVASRVTERTVLVTTSFQSGFLYGTFTTLPKHKFSIKAKKFSEEQNDPYKATIRFHKDTIKKDPQLFLNYLFHKGLASFFGRNNDPLLMPLILLNTPLLFMALMGFIFTFIKKNGLSMVEWLLVGVYIYFWLLSTLTSAALRYLVPVMWVMILFACEFIQQALIWRRNNNLNNS